MHRRISATVTTAGGISGTWASPTPGCIGGTIETARGRRKWNHDVLDLRTHPDYDGRGYYVAFGVVPGDSSGVPAVGHARVVWLIDDAVNRRTSVDSRGFYANGNTWTVLARLGNEHGEVRAENVALGTPEWTLLTRVNREAYDNARAVIDRFQDSFYSLTVRDCETFAMTVALATGVPNVPSRDAELTPVSWFQALASANRPLFNRSVPPN